MSRVWRDAAQAGLLTARERGNGIDYLQGDERRRAVQILEEVLSRWTKKVVGAGYRRLSPHPRGTRGYRPQH